MLADTLVEAGQLGGAVGGQVDEAQLHLLVIFVESIDLAAAGLALQTDVFAVAVGVELELAAAEGDFLIPFGVVEGIEDDRRLAVAAVGDARIDGKGYCLWLFRTAPGWRRFSPAWCGPRPSPGPD